MASERVHVAAYLVESGIDDTPETREAARAIGQAFAALHRCADLVDDPESLLHRMVRGIARLEVRDD